MLIRLDTTKETPIYLQLRNEIVAGIGRGEIGLGDHLPTVRQMAADIGINSMTVNKSYALLKAEGFIEIDRRHGAVVCPNSDADGTFKHRMEENLSLLVTESALKGIDKESFLDQVEKLFDHLDIRRTVEGT